MNRRHGIGFAVICIWQASAWLLPPASQGPSLLVRQGVAWAILALVAGAALVTGQRGAAKIPVAVAGSLAAAGLLVFAVPSLLVSQASDYASDTNVTLVFAFAPVVVVLAWSVFGGAGQAMRMLVPALMGAAGVLFVLPFESPVSLRGWEALTETVVAMIATSCGSVWLFAAARPLEGRLVVAIVGAGNAIVLLGWCGAHRGLSWTGWNATSLLSVVMTIVVFAVMVSLIRLVKPVRLGARFLVVPLVTLVEGMALIRPELTGRLAVGVALLAIGAAWLLFAPETVDNEVLSLR